MPAGKCDLIIIDFELGTDHLLDVLRYKSMFLQVLPTALGGLAYKDQTKAKAHFLNLRDRFAADPNPAGHDRVTLAYLDTSVVGSHAVNLERWATGQLCLSTCFKTMVSVTLFRFVPVIEIVQEAAHSVAQRNVVYTPGEGKEISLANRIIEIKRKMADNKPFKKDLAKLIETIRDPMDMMEIMGFSTHPFVQRKLGVGARGVKSIRKNHELEKILTSVIYRQDVQSQLAKHNVAKTYHDSTQRRMKDRDAASERLA